MQIALQLSSNEQIIYIEIDNGSSIPHVGEKIWISTSTSGQHAFNGHFEVKDRKWQLHLGNPTNSPVTKCSYGWSLVIDKAD